MARNNISIQKQLFENTSHSPALIDIVGRENLDKVIDYCFIANPYYPTTAMIDDLKEQLPTLIKYYPSSNPEIAKHNLASVIHVDPQQIVIGNGATELITIVERNVLNGRLAIPIPTFSEYIEKLRNNAEAEYFQLPPNDFYALNLNDYARWIDERSIASALIINPGNPTGQLIPREEVLGFLQRMKHLELIVLDESFIDFAGNDVPSLLPYIEQFSNLIVVRSMSKHCGVPGLRLGYCCTANPQFLRTINDSLPIWNINSIAEYILHQLEATDEIYHVTRKQVIADVEYLQQQLSMNKGLTVYPTGSNFILLKINFGITSRELQFRLLEEFGLYVRDCSNKAGMDNYHIRVASQGKEKDQYLIDALLAISRERIH